MDDKKHLFVDGKGEITGPEKPACLVMIPDRRFLGSSELYLYVDTGLAEFCTTIGMKENGNQPIAHIRWVRVGFENVCSRTQGIFRLTEVLPANSPVPCPILSLSGVLWTRQAALEAHQSISSYQERAKFY